MRRMATALFLTSLAGSAAAQDLTGVVFAGGTVSDGVSAYAGGLRALPGGRLGSGFAVRAAVNAGRYKYDAAAARISANYKGGEAALVHQWSGARGWGNLAVGARYTDTDLKPADPTNKRVGGRADLSIGTDGAIDFGSNRFGWYGAFGVFDESYQVQGRIGRVLNSKAQTVLGLEAGVQGDPSYETRTFGAYASTTLVGQWIGQVGLGASTQAGRDARAYGSLSLSRVF